MNRLQPRIRLVWVIRALVGAAVVTGLGVGAHLFLDVSRLIVAGIGGSIALLGVGHALLLYRRWGYEIRDDEVYLTRGVITEVRTAVPLVRIQHVDSRRGPLERTLGLASCVVYTAGSRGADVRIPGLTPDGANDLRERLKQLAIRAEGEDAV
jgi:Uncharacterized conserved protein